MEENNVQEQVDNTPVVDNQSTVEENGSTAQQYDQEVARAKEVQDAQERNFKAMREAQKRLERERDEERKRNAELQAMINRQYAGNQPQQQQQELADDDIAEVGYVKRELSKVQQALAEERQRAAIQRAELKLATRFPDYQEVLCDDNIEKLRMMEPEVMASIESNGDPYSKAVAAIKAMKSYGIHKGENISYERQKALANVNKPKTSAAYQPATSQSPLAQAHNFTGGRMSEAERRSIEMEARRRARGG